jgi:catechol 2,3-dioxygenase-like lactoylglutathione lyase family enzyme
MIAWKRNFRIYRARGLVRVFCIVGIALAVCAAAAVPTWGGNVPSSGFQPSGQLVDGVTAVAVTVADLDRSLDFYMRVLDFELIGREERSGDAVERLTGVFGARCDVATLRLGEERLELTSYRAPAGRPIPSDSTSNDRWFQHVAIVVSDMDRAFTRVVSAHVRFASSGPQLLPAWNANAGGISAFYFKDPDGHALELIHYPPGKGDPRWQRPTERLFLGIDHTAITVADTDRSLAFYRDVLGLRVAGTSENYGPEQEHLNNVFGAHLRITALRAAAGPGIELLEYLSPTTGRDYPRDSRPNDLWHWHVTLSAADAEPAVRRARAPWISAGRRGPDDRPSAFMARDPDGHALLFTTP